MRRHTFAFTLSCVVGVLYVGGAAADVSVLTYHNDQARTGQNLQETVLTPELVRSGVFQRLFSQSVDGQVYAQPLYVPHVSIANRGVHNVVFVATEHDSVYAFDADDNQGPNATPLWRTTFLVNGETTVPASDTGETGDLTPEIGITGTPVIDLASQTLYVVAKTKKSGQYFQRLHALSLGTGNDKVTPRLIDATVPGTGDGSDGTNVRFDQLKEHNRAGLVLSKGVVYTIFASHGDQGPYHGWVLGYNATTLAPVPNSVFNTTPNGGLGGIWQSGAAPAVDAAGNLFLETGNGTSSAPDDGTDYSECLLKMSTSGGLSVADYFQPSNRDDLDNRDADFGSGGTFLLPDQTGSHPHIAVAAEKDGNIFLVDRDAMGGFNASANDIVQEVDNQVGGQWSIGGYWNGHIYFVGNGDALKSFDVSAGQMSTSPTHQSDEFYNYPGAVPAISASGTTNGIVWTIEAASPATLRAYDATDVSQKLYDSGDRPSDSPGSAGVKFSVPTIANAHVYIGTRNNVTVFGPSGVGFSAANYKTTESMGTATITVKRTLPATGSLSVDYVVSDGSAVAGTDYEAVPSATLSFGPGVSVQSFKVKLMNTTVHDGNRTVILSLKNAVGGTVGPIGDAVLTIADNDVAGSVSFSAVSYSVKETAGQAVIKVLRHGGASSGVTVGYATSNGTATAGTDYTGTTGVLTFGPNVMMTTFTVPIIDHTNDGLAHDARTVHLALGAIGGGAVPAAPGEALLTINGLNTTLEFGAATYASPEGYAKATITVRRAPPLTGSVRVDFATADGTATAGTNYTSTSGTLTFGAGVATRTFQLALVNEVAVHSDKTVLLSLGNPQDGAGLGVQRTSVLTLRTDDPALSFTASSYAVSQSAAKAIITVRRMGAMNRAVGVQYATSDGSATAGTDYTSVTESLSFAPNVMQKTFTVSLLPQTGHPGPRTLNITLSNADGAVVGTPGVATLTIKDTLPPATLQLAVADQAIAESGGGATVTVTRTGSTTSTVSVDYATADGSAVSGTNYDATSGTLTFGPGEKSKTFTVPVHDDGASTGNLSVGVTLSNPGGDAVVGPAASGRIWIVDGE